MPSVPAPRRRRGGRRRWSRGSSRRRRRARRRASRFAYHNHDFEFGEPATSGAGSSPPGWTSSPTSAGCASPGRDPVAVLGELAGRCPLVHAKDVRPRRHGWEDVVVGEGELDWPAIARPPPRPAAPAGSSSSSTTLRGPGRRRGALARDAAARRGVSDLGVGLVGCGAISGVYLDNAPRLDGVRLVACADVDAERARRVAAEHGLDACDLEELLRHRTCRSCSA